MMTQFSNQIADLVASSAPSIVQVVGGRRPASGVIYDKQTILTTMSALGREEGLQARQHDDRLSEATLVGWDPSTGLAVLRCAQITAPALMASTATARVGNIALALGRSWTNAISASAGIIAVIGGPLRTGRKRSIEQVLRISAPMHEGFAGGAVLDPGGGLLGIATASAIRGFGVVIPIAIAQKAAASVVEHGRVKRGYLGVAAQPVRLTGAQRTASNQEAGVVIVAVTPDGPAAKAGMLVGDVLLSIDEQPIDAPETLMDVLLTIGAGHVSKLKTLRGSSPFDLTVAIGERPA
jgi:S1-C subfamily serine protease